MILTQKLVDWLGERYEPHPTPTTDEQKRKTYSRQAASAMLSGTLSEKEYTRLTEGEPPVFDSDSEQKGTKMSVDPSKVFGSDTEADQPRVRVKAPSEGLSEKRYSVTHTKTGQKVFDEFGQEACSPSEKSLAMAGVTLKLSAKKSGLSVEFSDWEKALLDEMIEGEQWASYAGDPHENKVFEGNRVKALLDDSTSGGLEIAPITFDADIVSNLLLTGELYPFVDVKPVSRGRRVEGGSVGHPTIQWGTGEGTEGTLFDFSSYVSAIDTTIFPATAFLEVGRDFLSDAAVDVGSIVVARIGEKFAEEMDGVIATGNGTTQPEGIINKSGTTSVAFGVSTSLGNYESLLFGVPKQYRKAPGNSFMFCGTEVSYQRARAMNVGAADARRLFGLTHEDYQLFPPRRYAINEDLTNAQIFAGDLKRYRMYRRLGLKTEWSTEGKSLMRSNTALLAVRFRFGGQVVTPEAFATVTDAPA